MLITEPTTMLTDYAIAVESFAFAVALFRRGNRLQQSSMQLWAIAFGFVGIAAALGGTFHGFAWYFDDVTRLKLWQAMNYSLGFASGFMLLGAIVSSVSRRWQLWGFAAVGSKGLIYASWTMFHIDFSYSVADYLLAMIAVMVLQAAALRRQQASAIWLISGILVSCLAAAVVQSDFSAGIFNHNDFYHLIQMVALYLFFQGARLLTDE